MSKYSQSIRTQKSEEVQIQRAEMPVTEAIPEALSTQEGKKKPAPSERIRRGYSLRKDLLRQIKGIAFEEERAINDVMEEGLQMVIESRKKSA
jgi:hypothetical protein